MAKHSRSNSSSRVLGMTIPSTITSKKIWKFSFLLLFIAIILLIVTATMPGSLEFNENSDTMKASDSLMFIGIWLGIFVFVYRLIKKQSVFNYFVFGFILAVIIPFVTFSIVGSLILNPLLDFFCIDSNSLNNTPIYKLIYLSTLYTLIFVFLNLIKNNVKTNK